MTSSTRKSRLLIALVGIVGAVAVACASNPPPDNAVYVVRRPPPDRVEVIGTAPGAGYVWVRGFWRWGDADYDWVPGRWMVAQRGYRRWEAGHWAHARRGWFWVEGRWR